MVFVLGMAWAITRLLKDPVWATMIVIYFYYAIPMREFYAPTLPYALIFSGLALALVWRTRIIAGDRAKKEIEERAVGAAKKAVETVSAEMIETLVNDMIDRRPRSEVVAHSIEENTPRMHEIVHEDAPGRVVSAAKAGVDQAVLPALQAAAAEAETVVNQAGSTNTSRGNLRHALLTRVTPAFNAVIEKKLAPTVLEEVSKLADEYQRRMRTSSSTRDSGILGVPLPRLGFAAVVTNSGIWLHLVFVILTYIGAKNAVHSQALGMDRFAISYLLFIPMITIAATVRGAWQFRLFIWAWMFGVFHLSKNGIEFWASYGGRADQVGGQMNDANFFAAIVVTVAPIALSMFLVEKTKLLRWGGLFVAAVYAVAVIASGSRGGLLSLVGATGYWFLWTNKKGIAFGLMMMGAAGFLVVAPAEFWERMGTMFLPKDSNPWIVYSHEESAESRKVLWALAIEIFKENPMTGIGPNNFVVVSAERTTYTFEGARGLMTHNTWLQLLAEYGIFGAGLWYLNYAAAIVWIMFARVKAKKLRGDKEYGWLPGYLLGMEAGLLGNAVSATFVSFQWLDYMYHIMVTGPLAYQVTMDTIRQREWFDEREVLTVAKPPPRYGPPKKAGLALDEIDLRSTPVIAKNT